MDIRSLIKEQIDLIIVEPKAFELNYKPRLFLVHGWDGSPKEPLFLWIKENLKLNYEVFLLDMPNPEKPTIEEWTQKIDEEVNSPKKTDTFIGHSIGCQAILRYVETISEKIKKMILVAPWMELDKNTIDEEGEEFEEIVEPWMSTPINFESIKKNCDKFIAIFSDNDKYVPLSTADIFKNELNAEILILKSKGHFDPSSKIKKLPEILGYL